MIVTKADSDRENQMTLEFFMNSAAICSYDKMLTGEVDK
jgi:hypothetical protein